jgi:hypothetical protein
MVPKPCTTDADCNPPDSTCNSRTMTCDTGCTVQNYCNGDFSCNALTGRCKIVPPPAKATDIFFTAFGDVRPAYRTDPYPTVCGTIWGHISAQNPHHAFVVGDYIEQDTNMFTDFLNAMHGNYAAAGPVHFVVGNHEANYFNTYTSVMSEGLVNGQMYYSIDDMAQNAKYVIIADDAWDATQKSWLQSELANPTRYTFVFRHHPSKFGAGSSSNFEALPPVDNTYATAAAEIIAVIDTGKPTLVIAGHSHFFGMSKNHWTDPTGHAREVIAGNGGAPLATDQPGFPPNYYGFTLFQVLPSGSVAVIAYKSADETGNVVDPPVPVEWHEVTP